MTMIRPMKANAIWRASIAQYSWKKMQPVSTEQTCRMPYSMGNAVVVS